ncbi:MAG: hypothetical protein A3A96_01045 [Candidatus Zambryskibacteria bacterium RIFCSPLOWO2_01_FULL_39_39]|uniref:Methyltransferase type 11 domain-containing protein n=1 Tax=Candidatus Zambryskibacteria bacterium RIFCSPLOWO2_01_FULL_39_39 TaxID=1802758 RepID=A0A1G2TYY0_9BACT|nr:MAG: hypothetical protein A2644_04335 [Candidatus Zambryskibacteria bacterium RIFCSPHIGHO2_01_FULL_39_63]OHA95070.1 MAG: hypothetical protein A3B88_03245 [Candidatus Zambryskibacteria bacterium RIFCSPHIGHO2_02_FULL_39_19]OHA98190.1 MAG: hypothetical protein A3F20_04055 [Candidatus Zambryskibacteria bacterium RIFCSPHIGHO2_12_FULL_39_21]OHB02444.1 MAG: hypothetical protein A3A96_01045 [Candidatus Zambryskibacteria bacterium RIFCSPLOWO2_01_FULL_39_39]
MVSGKSNVNPTIATKCAICGTYGNATEVYPAHLSGENLDEKAFSARRFYGEKIHFRMVKCNTCSLLRSDPIVSPEVYSELYNRSSFTYEGQVGNLIKTYGYYLKKLTSFIAEKEALLEIGCGNGFFLEEALRQGYKKVFGVEPSSEAIAKASVNIKASIKQGMFDKNMFPPNSFDVICMFQTLDHFLDPSKVLSDALILLKPGGVLIAINHNLKSLSARILGEKSPIIDIEHTYLYDKNTIRKLFEKCNYEVLKVFYPKSRHSLGYLFSLLPLRPLFVKSALHRFLDWTRLSKIPLFVQIGNLGIIARKK